MCCSSSAVSACYGAINCSFTLCFAVKVICDHFTGKSKGYGFVQFISDDAASKALKEMDGLVSFHSLIVIKLLV